MGGAAWVCGSGSAARDRCWDKQGLDTAWGESRELGEAGESFGQSLGALGKVGLGRGWGELRESLGKASGELGKRLGKASGELGEMLGRASGELRESFGRASSGKLRAGERLGKAFREMWGEPWQQLWGRQSATRGPWSATTYHKQEPGTDDKVPSHLFSKHCVQAQKNYDLTRSGNHFREHLTFPWIQGLGFRALGPE